MSRRREVKDLIEKLEDQGWTVTAAGKHWRATGPKPHQLSFLPVTPSDHRALLNMVSQLRRMGADL